MIVLLRLLFLFMDNDLRRWVLGFECNYVLTGYGLWLAYGCTTILIHGLHDAVTSTIGVLATMNRDQPFDYNATSLCPF
jgi:hypothetical protein